MSLSRRLHSLLGLPLAAVLVLVSVSGACLSLLPAWEQSRSVSHDAALTVAQAAAAVQRTHQNVERIVRTAAGALLAYPAQDTAEIADIVDPANGRTIGGYTPSESVRILTDLHRAFLLDMPGRAGTACIALAMLMLVISGGAMLAKRVGGWRFLLRPVKGGQQQRRHGTVGRIALLGLIMSASSGIYMSLAAFGLVETKEGRLPDFPSISEAGQRGPIAKLAALNSIRLRDLRELTFPLPEDPNDVFSILTSEGAGFINPVSGAMLTYRPYDLGQRVHQVIYTLHTGQGLWVFGLLEGLVAACVPVLAWTGLRLWLSRRKSRLAARRHSRAAPPHQIKMASPTRRPS